MLVIHAAADHPETTGAYLEWLSGELDERGSNTRLSLELRTTEGPADHRFDRSIESLGSFLTELDLPRTGMCWDVAHDWESGGSITRCRHGRCTGSTTCTFTTVAPMPQCMRRSMLDRFPGEKPWRR